MFLWPARNNIFEKGFVSATTKRDYESEREAWFGTFPHEKDLNYTCRLENAHKIVTFQKV